MNADLEKLINDYNYLAPIQTAELCFSENDNYYEFIKAATAKVLGEEYVFGVPYNYRLQCYTTINIILAMNKLRLGKELWNGSNKP